MKCPCKGCTKRWVSKTSRCHSSCKEYKEWYDPIKERKDLLNKSKDVEEKINSVRFKHMKF